MTNKLDSYEKEILDAFEKGELKSTSNLENEIKTAQVAAKNTFNKNKRVNLRLTEQDFDLAHIKAPYFLGMNICHKSVLIFL